MELLGQRAQFPIPPLDAAIQAWNIVKTWRPPSCHFTSERELTGQRAKFRIRSLEVAVRAETTVKKWQPPHGNFLFGGASGSEDTTSGRCRRDGDYCKNMFLGRYRMGGEYFMDMAATVRKLPVRKERFWVRVHGFPRYSLTDS